MGFIKLLILFSPLIHARTVLLEYTAKQSIHNIRYFFKDNDSVFYMKGKSTLAFSSNYKAHEVLKYKNPTQFTLTTHNNNDFLISAKPLINKTMSPAQNAEIYHYNLSTKKIKKVGDGVSPKFHLSGKFFSFYDQEKKILKIINNITGLLVTGIKVNSKSDYYIPQTEIFDEETIIYTDLNDQMIPGILQYNLTKNERKILHKLQSPSDILEICKKNNKVYSLESSVKTKGYANLYSMDYTQKDMSKRDFIFDSPMGPAHSLKCFNDSNNIFFIKNISGQSGQINELIRFDINTKKAYIQTDLKFTKRFLKMADSILVPFRDKIYYITNKDGKFTINKELIENEE